MTTDNRTSEPRRLKSCVEAWPECETGEYNPSCCRFPKSCSSTVYSEEHVTEDDLEPPAALVAAQGAARPVNGFDTTAERVQNWADSLHVTPVLPSSGLDEEKDERVLAWEQVAKHVALKQCYDEERPLLPAVLDRLTNLFDLEQTVRRIRKGD